MSKKKNKKNNFNDKISFDKGLGLSDQHSLIQKYVAKYGQFNLITEQLLEQLLEKISPTHVSMLDASFALDKAINLYFCKQIKDNDDMDLVMLLEDQYQSQFNLVLRKLGVKSEDMKNALEDILLFTIDTYDGRDSFVIYFTKVAKKYLIDKERSSLLNRISTNIHPLEAKEEIDDMPFIGHRLDILHHIPLDDETFVKFIIYYYGFKGFYATEDEIKKELNLSDDIYDGYLKRSYQILSRTLKKTFGEAIKASSAPQKTKENIS